MEIDRGIVETLDTLGGLWMQEYMRRVAVAARQERRKITFSLAKVFEQPPIKVCRLPPEHSWSPRIGKRSWRFGPSPWELPVQKLRSNLAGFLKCWSEGEICRADGFGDRLIVGGGPGGTRAETIEVIVLVATEPLLPKAEMADRDALIEIFDYLFPQWHEPGLLEEMLLDAREGPFRTTTEIEGVNVLIESPRLERTGNTYARVVLTKKASRDEFTSKRE
jgi:hypothetical protein